MLNKGGSIVADVPALCVSPVLLSPFPVALFCDANSAFAAFERFAAGENLGGGMAFAIPSISIPKGGGHLRRPKPKKKDTTHVVSFFLVEISGIEPLTS